MTTRIQTSASNSRILSEYLLYASSFCIPFFFSGPQMLVGSVVNTMLFLAATRLNRRNLLPLAILPSVAVLARGLVFGPFTPLIFYFLPFIWLGNFILMATFRNGTRIPQIPRIILASGLKGLWLASIAALFVNFNIVPEMFLTAMGWTQFATAIIGGFIVLGLIQVLDR